MDPIVERLHLATLDGVAVTALLYLPPRSPRATVLMAGAAAVPQGFYRRFATALTGRGLAVLTVDYRGIGESRPADGLRGFRATMRDWGELDLFAALEHLRGRFPHLPRVLVGHSFGGQAVGLLPHVRDLAGIATVGSQLAFDAEWPTLSGRVGMRLLTRVLLPGLSRTVGYVPGWAGLGEDMPGGVATEWATWLRSPRYLLDHVPEAEERFARVSCPVHATALSDDTYAPVSMVRALAATMPTAELAVLQPEALGLSAIGHFGWFRPECASQWETLVARIDGWTERRAA